MRSRGLAGLGLLASIVFGAAAFAGLDWEVVLHQVSSAHPALLALAGVCAVASSLCRAWRWQALLVAIPGRTYGACFSSMMIGNLANNVLPARAGEAMRVLVFARRVRSSMAAVAASVLLERTVDLLLLGGLTLLLPFLLPVREDVRQGARAGAMVVALLGAGLLALSFQPTPPAEAPPWRRLLARFAAGLAALRDAQAFGRAAALTAVTWATEVVMVWLVLRAAGLAVPFAAGISVIALIAIGSVIPSAPGAIGTYEFLVKLALAPYGVEASPAVGAALLLHGLVYVTSVTIGLACLSMEGRSWADLRAGLATPQEAKA